MADFNPDQYLATNSDPNKQTNQSTFDPDAYLTQTNNNMKRTQTAPVGAESKFNPDQYLSNNNVTKSTQPASLSAESNISTAKSPESSRDWVWSHITTDKELEDIANKHKVDPETLKRVAAGFGASKENETLSDQIKQALGFAGEAVGLGLPQKAYKKIQSPEMERALDDLSELAEKKKSYLREASELIGGLAIPGGMVAKLGKAAFPAFGAAAGLGHSKAGEELKDTGTGAAVGAALGAGLAGLGAAGRGISKVLNKPKSTETLLTKSESGIDDLISQELAGQTGKTVEAEKAALKTGEIKDPITFLGGEAKVAEQLAPTESAYKLISHDLAEQKLPITTDNLVNTLAENKLEALRDSITSRTKSESWEKAVKEQGGIDRLVDDVFTNLRHEDIAKNIITEQNLAKNLPNIPTLKGIIYKVADNKPVMKIIDKRLGGGERFSAEQTVDELSSNIARASTSVKNNLKDIEQFDNLLNKKGIDKDTFNIEQLNDPEIRKVWDSMTAKFEQEANQQGANVKDITHYIQNQPKAPVELQTALQGKIDELSNAFKTNIKDLSEEEFKNLASKSEFKELKSAVDVLSGETNKTAGQFSLNLKNILEDTVSPYEKMISNIANIRETQGVIPEFIIEKNPVRALEGWITSTYKNLAIRNPIEKLRSIANIADEAGDAWTARHLRDTIQDVVGVRKDTIAGGTRQAFNRWASYWNNKGHEGLAQLPEYFTALNRQIYANLIGGLNVKAQLQNIATPLLSAIPDVGLKEGTRAWWNGVGQANQLFLKGGKTGVEKFLAEKGIIPAQYMEDIANLKATTGKLGKLNNASNEALMYLFNLSELTARAQTYFMGQELGSRIAQNPEWGKQFINKLNSPAYRKTLGQALSRGDEQTIKDQLSRYLNSNHLLNYDKANQSAFGRYVGSTFSMFTKWPTTMLGKVLQEAEDKGLSGGSIEVAKKIMAPVIALAIVDRVTRGGEPSDRSSRFLGQHLSAMAPGDALKELTKITTPSANLGGKFGDALMTVGKAKDEEGFKSAARRAVNDLGTTFLPFAGWLKMFGEDIPTFLHNQKPEGYSLERKVGTILRGGRPTQK